MNDNTPSSGPAAAPPLRREVVGLFAARKDFEAAVAALRAAGFERADLSVLSSHESIDAAEETDEPWKDALTALVGELKYEGPLVASGAILLAGGPTAAAIAAVIGAATAGVAAFQVLEEVTDKPQTEDFARSLKAGSVILWVTAAAKDREELAAAILSDHGAGNVHVIETGGKKS
ncbi:MAG TPA: hypothetical protein ENI55_01410 [Alphaproteobacteria bacterium]|nr:hypothetical protein [Alphaproteobacteria bacterium]